jgi:integrase
MRTHNEKPVKRVGKRGTKWIARYTNKAGKRVSAGSFALRGPCQNPLPDADCCAQHAIDAAYNKEDEADRRRAAQTVGEYAATWIGRYPRGERTNATNEHRISRVLDVEIEGRKLRDWSFRDLKRRHVTDLVDALLTTQGRAATGATGILRTLSAMIEDAITDELADVNAVKGVHVRKTDVRVRKPSRKPNVYTLEQMHAFAAASHHEAMIRVLSDCGLRLGELLGLDRSDFDGTTLHLRGSAHNGVLTLGDTATKIHVRDVPASPSLARLLRATPARIDTPVMFPTPRGCRWIERNFYRDVWDKAREAFPAMADARPHDFRHSWVTILRSNPRVDDADLALMTGHSLETATAVYTHPRMRSDDAVRAAIG